MARIMFTNWEGGGHIFPMLMLAADLHRQGHDVLVLCDACNAEDADPLGLPFRPWRKGPSRTDKHHDSATFRDWEVAPGPAAAERLCDAVMFGPAAAYAADIREALEDFPADLIVTHDYMFGAMVAAEAAGIPLVIFTATIWMLPTFDHVPPARAGLLPAKNEQDRTRHREMNLASRQLFEHGLKDLNLARAGEGLGPLTSVFEQLKVVDKVLLGTSRHFDFEVGLPADRFVYVGPYVCDPLWVDRGLNLDLDDQIPFILGSASTQYQSPEKTLTNMIAALGGLPVQAVVTLGPGVQLDHSPPRNVRTVASASHAELLRRADVMITHAGHGSVMRGLMAGVPLLCMPKGRDQFAISARVKAKGAGLILKADATAAEIAEAVDQLLNDPSYAEAARALGADITVENDGRFASIEIEALLRVQSIERLKVVSA